MSEFCYVIDDGKGNRLYLSSEGIEQESTALADELEQNDFHHAEDRKIGSCTLHIYERAKPATDIVGAVSNIDS